MRAIPNGKTLLPAAITPPVWQGISDALLQRQAIEVHYLSRQKQEVKEYTLHPQGLVARHSVSNLLTTPDEDGWITLSATVPNDQQTQWWLMGFGARVEVLEPAEWRQAIAEQANKMMNMYAQKEYQLTGG